MVIQNTTYGLLRYLVFMFIQFHMHKYSIQLWQCSGHKSIRSNKILSTKIGARLAHMTSTVILYRWTLHCTELNGPLHLSGYRKYNFFLGILLSVTNYNVGLMQSNPNYASQLCIYVEHNMCVCVFYIHI